ncbi:MAG: response regulator [Treponema sp.]|nr:response regulator [Treponema sp.]
MSNERKKVFLVDDTEFGLVRTKQFLKDYYTVYALDSSSKMFDLLEKVIPDLILLDIEMPGKDGYEVIKILKNDERYAEVPVIFLSGKYDEESIIKGLSLGAVDYVVKPYSPQDLQSRISYNIDSYKFQGDFHIDRDKNASKQLSILVVDDSPSILRAINFALNNKYKVHTLQKPENLKKVLASIKPDLFLLDYNMPEVNGFDLLRTIREFPEYKETPVIFLTAERSEDNLKEAISLGSSGYILKPFNPNALREKISKCLSVKD